MTMVILRELRPEEEAVLDAIIAQRIDCESDYFEYDYKKVREYLNKTGTSRKLIITPDIQRKIAIELSFAHIIDMDSIVDKVFINNLRSVQNPNYVPDESMPDYFWLNNTDWASEYYQHDGTISVEEAYSLYGSGIFIRMTRDEASELTNDYINNRVVKLKIDLSRNRLCIKADDEEDWLCSPALHEDRPPFKILCYAFNNPNRKISRDELYNKAGIDVRKKYLE